MSQTYPAKKTRLEGEDQARIQRLVEEIQGRLHELAAIVTRVLGIPLTPDITPKFVPIKTVSGAPGGVLILPLPTDPPSEACLYCIDRLLHRDRDSLRQDPDSHLKRFADYSDTLVTA